MEDGNVWRWQHWTKALTLLDRLFVSTVGGSIVGLCGSLLMAVVILLRNRRKKE
ncbi:MAG: hypothetical protein U0401_05725 [Anaerolineae bacterium]